MTPNIPLHLTTLQLMLNALVADGIRVEVYNAPHDGCVYIAIPGIALVDGHLREEQSK